MRGDLRDAISVDRRHHAAVALVIAHREELHPAGSQETVHGALVVSDDLGAGRQVRAAFSQGHGVQTVERCGLVQLDERVSIIPVTARAVAPVHDHDAGGRVLREDHVGERQAHGASAEDQIVGIESRRSHCGACGAARQGRVRSTHDYEPRAATLRRLEVSAFRNVRLPESPERQPACIPAATDVRRQDGYQTAAGAEGPRLPSGLLTVKA